MKKGTKFKVFYYIVLYGLLLLSGGFVHEAYAETATVSPIADTSIDSIGNVQSIDPNISAGNWLGFNWFSSPMKFNLTGVTGTVTNATLQIFITGCPDGDTTFNVYGSSDDGWIEDQNMTVAPTPTTLLAENVSVTAADVGKWKAIPLINLSYFENKLDKSKVTVLINEATGGSAYSFTFSSREGTNSEILSVTYVPIIAADAPMTESNLDSRSIAVTLKGDTFADTSLDKANFALNNAPVGLTLESVIYTDSTHCTVNLAYDGTDFDSDVTNLGVTIKAAELTSGLDLTASESLTITAVNDPEAIAISDDGNIREGSEGGEKITVDITGGTFAAINPINWAVTGLPAGVSKGAVTKISPTRVEITLVGNATANYDSDITNIGVSLTSSEYADSTGGGGLSASSGVTFRANTSPTVITNTTISSITANTATVSGNVTSDGGLAITARGIEYKKQGDLSYIVVPKGDTGTGAYSVNLAGLQSATTYDVRAYAKNTEGTSYGSVVTFSTTNTNPTISDVTDKSTNEDTSITDISFTIGDAETPAASLIVSATSDNHALISNTAYSFGGSGTDRTLTITPELNQYGTANVTVTVSDGSGGTVQDTFKVTVNPVNDAPELFPFPGLFNIINEDNITSIGNPIFTIAGPMPDVDGPAVQGIAVTSTTITTGNGNWQYSIDNGVNWNNIDTVSENSALLLSNFNMVRFVPDEKNGATGSITYRAWDGTSGSEGDKVDTTTNGGTSAFSTNTNTASITVTAVNDAPVLSPTAPTLTTIYADNINNAGQTVASFIGESISDVDSGAVEGIAITAAANGNGTWEYSIDNGCTWTEIGAVAGSSALLLRDTDKVRFVPNGQDSTTASITYRAWDRTSGSEGNKVDTSTNGGVTSFSTATDIASITVNKIPPKIQTVTVPSDGTYKAGYYLDFIVNFNENVDVTGAPQLVLTIGSTTRTATYVSGSGTSALVFRYTVQAGDNDNDGIAINLLELNGGTIKDSATNNATLTLNGIGSTTGVKVDAVAPTVQSVAVLSNGTYKAGENLDFTVNYSEAVVVTGTPQLSLTIGSTTRKATYVSGTGTSALVFSYTVQAGDSDNDGITVNGLELNGGTIKDSIGNDATLTLNGVGVTTGVKVDTTEPTINSSSLAESNVYVDITFSEGVYGANDGTTALTASKFALTFTKNTGTSTGVVISSIKKNDSAVEGSASALTGGETTVRVFLNVADTPNGAETIEIKPANALSIYDKAGNALSITQTTGVKTLNDKVSPTVQSVAVPSNGTYKAGDNLDFTVNFSKTVTVIGTPQLSLDIGGVTRKATFVSGSGTSALVFRYTVQAGDNDSDGMTVIGLELNGGTIKYSATNDATLTLNGVASTTEVKVDTTSPTVQSVAVPSDGTYKAGENLDFTVNYSEAVAVTGIPQLSLSIGGATRKAIYVSGTGTSALVFSYTVQAGDSDNDGIAVSELELNGGTIKDSATNNATLTLNGVGSTTGVKVDAVAPTVQSVAVPSDGTYKAGENLDFTVNYSEAVAVTGIPQLSLSIGGATRKAIYVSGTGTSALVFSYTVQAGDSDDDGITVSGLELNGGTIKDSIGNDATLTLNAVGATTGVKVDTVAPTFNPATGTVIDSTFKTVTLTFSENILNALGDINSLKNAVAFAADGVNYNALGINDTVSIINNKLVIAFQNALTGNFSKIQIAGNSLKDQAGNKLTDLITTNSIIISTVPASPTGVGAIAGNGSAVISFTVPTNNGGSAITGYTVTASPGNITATGNGSPITITGLTNGTSYTFTVTATNAIGTGIPSVSSNSITPVVPYIPPSGGGGGSQPNTEPQPQQITVNVTDDTNNNVLSGTTIQRTTETDGTKKDVVQYTADKAQETVEKLKEAGKDTARLAIPDEKDEVAEAEIKIPTTTLSIIAQGNINLQIDTENARISLPKDSIKNLDENLKQDLFFRLVPIKQEQQRKEIVERAKQEAIVKQAINGSGIFVVGRPMTIETNMSQRSVDIVLPLKDITIPSDPKAREEFFSKIGIFIEHSDGEKALTKGEIVEYKNGVLGIRFTIKKFSTFTIIKLNEGEFDENLNISSNGGFGGPKTFMPDKEMTITFNKELNEGTLTKDSIYVEDSKGNKVEAVLKYNATGKTVTVTPSKYYNIGETYYLCVTDKLLSTTGKSITKKIRYSFNIGNVK